MFNRGDVDKPCRRSSVADEWSAEGVVVVLKNEYRRLWVGFGLVLCGIDCDKEIRTRKLQSHVEW